MKTKTRAEIFGGNLERIMQEKRISRKELADYLGVSVPAVFTYIHGKKQPHLDKIFAIADFLKVPVISLIGDNDYNILLPDIASIDKIIFEYKFSRALRIAIAANFDVKEYNKAIIISIPTTTHYVENGTISVIPVVETYKIKDKDSFVEIIEQSELQAIKSNKPFLEIFKEKVTPPK